MKKIKNIEKNTPNKIKINAENQNKYLKYFKPIFS